MTQEPSVPKTFHTTKDNRPFSVREAKREDATANEDEPRGSADRAGALDMSRVWDKRFSPWMTI